MNQCLQDPLSETTRRFSMRELPPRERAPLGGPSFSFEIPWFSFSFVSRVFDSFQRFKDFERSRPPWGPAERLVFLYVGIRSSGGLAGSLAHCRRPFSDRLLQRFSTLKRAKRGVQKGPRCRPETDGSHVDFRAAEGSLFGDTALNGNRRQKCSFRGPKRGLRGSSGASVPRSFFRLRSEAVFDVRKAHFGVQKRSPWGSLCGSLGRFRRRKRRFEEERRDSPYHVTFPDPMPLGNRWESRRFPKMQRPSVRGHGIQRISTETNVRNARFWV